MAPSHDQTRTRVVHVITGLNTGGAELMLVKLLSGMDRSRFESSVISLTPPGPVQDKLTALGIPVFSLGLTRGMPDVRGVGRLFKQLILVRPHIVQTWLYHADLLGGLVGRLAYRPKVVWNIRNSTLQAGSTKRLTVLTVGACARLSRFLPDKILCCSEQAKALHIRWGYAADRFEVIPNGFDLSAWKPDAAAGRLARKSLGIPLDARVVGLVGRYDPQKDHACFLEAAGQVSRSLPDVHFILAGDGVTLENPELRALVDKTGLHARIHLLGRRSDLPVLTNAFDLAASSSAYGEAFSNVLGEAMACGVPCVATDVGDAALILADTGRVVMPRSPHGLAGALEALLRLPENARRALGTAARARVESHFDLAQVVLRYQAVYDALRVPGRSA